jgi:hypothetical protein
MSGMPLVITIADCRFATPCWPDNAFATPLLPPPPMRFIRLMLLFRRWPQQYWLRHFRRLQELVSMFSGQACCHIAADAADIDG